MDAASRKAVRAAVATTTPDGPRVRMVHPTWEVIDYDLAQFWPAGVDDPDHVAVRITPGRVELSEMFGSLNKRVWRA